jgi:hypothetical protein
MVTEITNLEKADKSLLFQIVLDFVFNIQNMKRKLFQLMANEIKLNPQQIFKTKK